MKRPDKVRVGPHRYRIRYDKDAIDLKATEHNERRLYGLTEPTAQVIHIDPTLAPDQLRDTVLHEVLHACLSLIGADEQLSPGKEERLVRALSPVLLQVLCDNPKLARFLTGR